jgi:two-component system nitrate/nitrite response regulator NarL
MSLPRVPQKPVRVMLVDRYAIARDGLRLVIESRPEMKVVGEAGDVTEALSLIGSEPLDIVLLCHYAGYKDFDRLSDLMAAAGEARVLILAEENDSEAYHEAVRSGVMGVVLKNQTSDILLKAIRKVYEGEVWLDRAMIASVLRRIACANKEADPETAKIAKLTERERDVISLIGEGLRNRDIASRLFISEGTVRHHLTSIFNKLGTADRLELVIYAYRHHLLAPPPKPLPFRGEAK